MTDMIYVVTHEVPESTGGLFWLWSKEEAEQVFKTEREAWNGKAVVKLYRIPIDEILTQALDEIFVSNDPDKDESVELLESFVPAQASEIEEAQSVVAAMVEKAENEVQALKARIADLRVDYAKDPHPLTQKQIERVEARYERKVKEAQALALVVSQFSK